MSASARRWLSVVLVTSATALVSGCPAAPQNEVRSGARAGATFEVVNESRETICYLYASEGAQSDDDLSDDDLGPDHLDPAETLRPGEQEQLTLAPGSWHVTLQDCTETDMLVRDVDVDEAGATLVFRGRED